MSRLQTLQRQTETAAPHAANFRESNLPICVVRSKCKQNRATKKNTKNKDQAEAKDHVSRPTATKPNGEQKSLDKIDKFATMRRRRPGLFQLLLLLNEFFIYDNVYVI